MSKIKIDLTDKFSKVTRVIPWLTAIFVLALFGSLFLALFVTALMILIVMNIIRFVKHLVLKEENTLKEIEVEVI